MDEVGNLLEISIKSHTIIHAKVNVVLGTCQKLELFNIYVPDPAR
jgi:hypothetical protein